MLRLFAFVPLPLIMIFLYLYGLPGRTQMERREYKAQVTELKTADVS